MPMSNPAKRGSFWPVCSKNAGLTAVWMTIDGRCTQPTDRLHVLFNHAKRALPAYVGEANPASYVNVPRAEMAAAVYAAARNGKMGVIPSARLWCDIRFGR